jgi:hypothetical protein
LYEVGSGIDIGPGAESGAIDESRAVTLEIAARAVLAGTGRSQLRPVLPAE